MTTAASPAKGAPTESVEQNACVDVAPPAPSDAAAAKLVGSAVTVTPPRQNARPPPTSSCKRRRLDSEDGENLGGDAPASPARKLNYERRNGHDADDSTDGSDDEEEDPIDREIAQERQESVLRKIRRLNYDEGGEGEDKLISKAASARLFEYVKDYDVVAAASAFKAPGSEEGGSEGAWKYRGSGHVKVGTQLLVCDTS